MASLFRIPGRQGDDVLNLDRVCLITGELDANGRPYTRFWIDEPYGSHWVDAPWPVAETIDRLRDPLFRVRS